MVNFFFGICINFAVLFQMGYIALIVLFLPFFVFIITFTSYPNHKMYPSIPNMKYQGILPNT